MFEPKLIGFLCNWCTSSAADLAGTTRLKYPSNLSAIRVMCSGSVDPSYVIRAYLEGADGVLIGGCHPGDCHYINGNYKARRRMALVKNIFRTLRLEEERIWLKWIGADESKKFAETVANMTEEMRKRGPNPIKQHWEV